VAYAAPKAYKHLSGNPTALESIKNSTKIIALGGTLSSPYVNRAYKYLTKRNTRVAEKPGSSVSSKGSSASPDPDNNKQDKSRKIKWPGNDPAKAPKETKWKGKPNSAPGSKDGNYYNSKTKESYRPDLNHDEPIGPHWDYRAPDGSWHRIKPNGSIIPK